MRRDSAQPRRAWTEGDGHEHSGGSVPALVPVLSCGGEFTASRDCRSCLQVLRKLQELCRLVRLWRCNYHTRKGRDLVFLMFDDF